MASSKHCGSSIRALRSVLTPPPSKEITIPTFLVPTFAQPRTTPPRQTAHFSTTCRYRSKIGRAPLSLPPEVTFTIFDSPHTNASRNVSRSEPNKTVEVKGPLGSLKLDVPSYIEVESHAENGTYALSILDTKDKKQRAMWGE
jgi:large subunit ribosomal protein L6